MLFGDRILAYKDEIFRDIKELVSIPSCAVPQSGEYPCGEEAARALQWILSRAKEMGLETVNIDNAAGHAQYGEGPEVAAVLTHVDVVPAGDSWSSDQMCIRDSYWRVASNGGIRKPFFRIGYHIDGPWQGRHPHPDISPFQSRSGRCGTADELSILTKGNFPIGPDIQQQGRAFFLQHPACYYSCGDIRPHKSGSASRKISMCRQELPESQ